MKIVIRSLEVGLAIVGVLWAVSWATGWINAPSNVKVLAGTCILIGLLGGVIALAWHWGKQALEHFKILALLILAAAATGCTTVGPGYVGIQVNSWGSQRGVQDFPLSTGVIMYNPITTSVVEFPTFQQRIVWVRNMNEGSAVDESIGCRSSEGTSINFDISVGYLIKREMVPALYVRFKQTPEGLTGTYIRDQVRKELCAEAEKVKIMDILGAQLGPMTTRVTNTLNATIETATGIHFDYVSTTGKPHVDPSVEAAINNVVTAVQMANAAEQTQRKVLAEAQQARDKAQGEADASRIYAQGQADGNNLLSRSLTSEVVTFRMLQKWDGNLPQVTGGANPFINLQLK